MIATRIMTHSPEETEAVGRKLASQLTAGDVVALYGDLGAGKTCLIRGLAEGLGCPDAVSSPTFTLLNEYYGSLPLYHVDLYRLERLAEIMDLGLDDYFYGSGITVVEWAEKAGAIFPRRHWTVRIDIVDSTTRRLAITPPAAAA